jgi:hypothetical protein
MDGGDTALIDCIRICPSLNQGVNYIGLITLIGSTRCGSAIARIVNRLRTSAVRGRHLRTAREQVGNRSRKIGGRRDMEGCVAGIRIVSDSFEVKRFCIGTGRPGYQSCRSKRPIPLEYREGLLQVEVCNRTNKAEQQLLRRPVGPDSPSIRHARNDGRSFPRTPRTRTWP